MELSGTGTDIIDRITIAIMQAADKSKTCQE